MKNYQKFLKRTREQKNISINGIAAKMNFLPETVIMLESTNDIFELNLPIKSIKNYFRKYAECLDIPEKKIVRILNYIDYLEHNRFSKKGKIKSFDLINRTIIFILILIITYLSYKFYLQEKKNIMTKNIVLLPSSKYSEFSHHKNLEANDEFDFANFTDRVILESLKNIRN